MFRLNDFYNFSFSDWHVFISSFYYRDTYGFETDEFFEINEAFTKRDWDISV